ncbi:MAG: FkbM family methyltransferase [Bacteroidia bacterium]
MKKLLFLLNATVLLWKPGLSWQLSKGAFNWYPFRRTNFKFKSGRLISKIDNTNISTKHIGKFDYSVVNIQHALEKYIFEEQGDQVFFSPKRFPSLRFFFQGYDNIIVADEIFRDGVYDIDINSSLTVFDVGANIGLATTFFATRPFVNRVISFEPFPGTFKSAVKNIRLNNLENVELLNIGLAGEDKVVNVPMGDSGFLGASTTDFVLEEQKKLFSLSGNLVPLELKQASTLIRSKMDILKDEHYLLKLDCEGAEYEIIEDLSKANMLDRFAVIIIEWHSKGAEPIIPYLKNAGFSILKFGINAMVPLGMIYAFNPNKEAVNASTYSIFQKVANK